MLTEHVKLSTERGDAHTAFINACGQMRVEGALESDDGQWRDIALIARCWSEPTTVRVPHDASAPWPLVRVGLVLMERLTWRRPALIPGPGFPVVRRLLAGFVSLDHNGVKQRLLPDSDGWYWLRGFALSTPASEQSAGQPDSTPPRT